MLILKLLPLQTCQGTQTHIYNRLSLHIGELKTFNQSVFCNLSCLAASDNLYYFIDMI